MSGDHTTTVDRLRLFETTRRADAMDRSNEAEKNDAAARGTFPAGSRVLDLVTGRDGVVVDPNVKNGSVPRFVSIRLDSGELYVRRPDQLYPRPTPPTA
jgi:hypothetical protein